MNLLGYRSILTRLSAASAVVLLAASSALSATHEQVLHSFSGVASGGATAMIFDSAGNLYGTANPGLADTGGVVFKLSPISNGQWSYEVLYVFKNGYDGAYPSGRLVMDSSGNLYGTTGQAGYYNCGTAYELTPNSSGLWDFSVLHAFTCSDGWGSESGMLFDAAGNLYGGTSGGGLYGSGTAFELTRDSNGKWAFHSIFNFTGNGPTTDLVMDSEGNLYGAGYSAVFELSPQMDGSWAETSSYTFNTADGIYPFGRLTRDIAGNLYLTNTSGGEFHNGTALRLSPQLDGTWVSTVLHSFNASLPDGRTPASGLALDDVGNLYGSTTSGGGRKAGAIFKLTRDGNGQYTESLLYSFAPGNDGYQPQTGLVLDAKGNVYGATTWGGTSGRGVVFKIIQ
jgi:hypothetical protein